MNYNKKIFVVALIVCSSFFIQSMDQRSSGSEKFDIVSYIPSNPWAESYRSGLVESKNLLLEKSSSEDCQENHAEFVIRFVQLHKAKDIVKLKVFNEQYPDSLWFKGSIVSGVVCCISLGALSLDSCNQSSFKKELAEVAIKAGVVSCGCLVTDLLSYYRAKKAVADIDIDIDKKDS